MGFSWWCGYEGKAKHKDAAAGVKDRAGTSVKVPYLATFDASGRIFLLITASAVDFLFFRYERFGSNGIFAYTAREAFFVPLSCLVLHFFRAC